MSRRNKRETLNFELTPLIDVVFLLLIFFMVSSVFKKEELALMLNLPQAKSGEGKGAEKKLVQLEINKDQIAYDGKEILMADLDQTLSSLNKKTIINLRVDNKVVYERFVSVLDLLQKYQLENISLITDKASK